MRRVAPGKFGTVSRTVLFLPQIIPLVAAGIVYIAGCDEVFVLLHRRRCMHAERRRDRLGGVARLEDLERQILVEEQFQPIDQLAGRGLLLEARHLAGIERYMFAENIQNHDSRYTSHGAEFASDFDSVIELMQRLHAESLAIRQADRPRFTAQMQNARRS